MSWDVGRVCGGEVREMSATSVWGKIGNQILPNRIRVMRTLTQCTGVRTHAHTHARTRARARTHARTHTHREREREKKKKEKREGVKIL